MTLTEKAREMLRDLEVQLAHYEEQATLARGALQALRHLLANSEDVTDEQLPDDTAD
jgi:hypothetical protein